MRKIIVTVIIVLLVGLNVYQFTKPPKTAIKTVTNTVTKVVYDKELETKYNKLKAEYDQLQGEYDRDEALLNGKIITIGGMRFQLKSTEMIYPPCIEGGK